MRRQRKSSAVGAFLIAIILVLLVGGFGYMTNGFRNWDAKTWFNPGGGEQETPSETTQPIETGGTQAAAMGYLANSPMPRSPSRIWEVTGEGVRDCEISVVNGGSNITHSFNTKEERNNPLGDTHEYRTTFSADLSDLIAQGYVNFKLTSGSREVTVTVSGNTYSWLIMGLGNDDPSYVAITCETSWTMVPLPADPVKEGYTFTGWYTDEACTQLYTGSTVRDDMTLYAGFRINQYTITFDEAGGGSVGDVTSNYNTTPALPTPTREGYNFLGWFTADGQAYDATAPLKSNKALVAHWEIKKFKVTFMVDGAVYQEMTVDYGAALVPAAKELLLNVLAVEGAAGSVAVGEDGEISVLNDVVVLASPMQGVEKAATWGVQNIIGVVAGVVLLALVVGFIGAVTSKKQVR